MNHHLQPIQEDRQDAKDVLNGRLGYFAWGLALAFLKEAKPVRKFKGPRL